MADDFKTTVSRTLDTTNRQYTNVLWQAGKPPLDSELNLVGQIATKNLEKSVSAVGHSGILMNPRTSERGFEFNPLWSNFLKVKPFKALINGMTIDVEEATINLSPPPPQGQGNRVDFVFLEVWKTIISADGSGIAEAELLKIKPTTTTVYSNGNVNGVSSLPDEMVDSSIGFETTKRVQIQYRFRVINGIDIYSNIEGMSSTLVKGQGPLENPNNLSVFHNQSQNGDAGLWVAHMTDDGTAAGNPLSGFLSENLVYGIPICAITRRNDSAYVAVSSGLNTNQNGSVNRKPSSSVSSDATTLLQATLTTALNADTLGAVELSNGVGSGLDDEALYGSERYLVIGEGLNKEIIRVSGFTSPNLTVVARGEAGTQAKYHSLGSKVVLFNNRPDGKYADQIHQEDLFDMRHATTVGEWDYQSLLESALSDLLFGNLKTAYKQNQENATVSGVTIEEVSVIDAQNLNQTFAMDFPNGFRDTWSDAAVPQMGISLYLNLPNARLLNGTTTTDLNEANATNWTIGPDLNPTAFIYDGLEMKSGSWIKLSLNDQQTNLAYGVNEAAGSNTLSERGVRFIAPKEMRDNTKKRAPFTIEELGRNHNTIHHPTAQSNFERPFIVLGRSRFSQTFVTSTVDDPVTTNFKYLYRPTAANTSKVVLEQQVVSSFTDRLVGVRLGSSAEDVSATLKGLENLVTNDGYDTSGDQSSLYCVLFGDPANQQNNGVFKVIDILDDDADTPNALYYSDLGKTEWAPTSKVGWIILEPIDNIDRTAGLTPDLSLTIDFRTQDITDQDDEVMLAITESTDHTYDNGGLITSLGKLHITSEFQLGVSILYPPATGGIANVAEDIHKIGIIPEVSTGEFLNNSKSVLHGNNYANLPLVENEIDLPTKNHVSLWNRLPSSNLPVGVAQPNQMGGRVINEEADREAEAFTDELSKTLVLRPFQNKTVVINKATSDNLNVLGVNTPLIPQNWENGAGAFTDPSNNANDEMFLSTKDAAFVLPEALMPRFGRQDIPLHTNTGNGDQFQNGLNHIFTDKISASSDAVFNIIGGLSNVGNPGVNNILFVTGDAGTRWGERKQIADIGNNKGIGARKTSLTVPTSDFGPTLNGIELPPYYGIARVYGVYEARLFNAHLSQLGGHELNRFTVANNVSSGACPNLLRTDASDFTMYINQNGGTSYVNDATYQNAHTYMITEHAIDITRLKDKGVDWVDGSVFTDFDYVVEAVVFMFADGFISHNRYVLPRKYNGSGDTVGATEAQKVVVDSVIPFAPPRGSHITVAYKRTPYQGDPLGTLGDIDQTVPQGRKNLAQLTLGTKTQPVDLSSTNKRNVEVLASMDFYTTLGTGKIGGEVYPTTITDVGHTPFPLNRDPSILLAQDNTLTHIPLKTSTFTEESDKVGGWSSLFLFEQPEENLFDNVVLALYKNGTSVSSITLSSINLDGDAATKTVEEQVVAIMQWLQDLGYNNFQTRGEIRQNATDNQNYYGILIQAPNPIDTFELEVQWKDKRNGQEIQVFEGLRTTPLSFEMFFNIVPVQINYEYKLNSRTQSKVAFSSVSLPPLNAGSGNTPISLTGMTSRLPIGSLVRDSDFVCEDILSDRSSYLFTSTGSFSTISNPVPVNPDGIPYTSTLGVSGDTLQINDGKIYHLLNPANQTKYTISRGGGSVFGVGGKTPGGPLSFLSTSFGESLKPVLKGSALAGRAMLVANFYEADDNSRPRSYGSELQLVITTYAIDGGTKAITFGGDISPSGYGEGFAAADRFRIKGKPLAKIYNQDITLNVDPAPFNSN